MTQDESGFKNTHPNAERDQSKRAILLVAHGSTTESETGAIARKLRTDLFYAEDMHATVEVAFWKEEPSIDTALQGIEADAIYVLPLLMSDGYFFRECFPAMLDIECRPGEWQDNHGREVFYEYPVGESPFLLNALLDLVSEGDRRLSKDAKAANDDGSEKTEGDDCSSKDVPSDRADGAEIKLDEDAAIILVGHGTPRNKESTKEVHQRVHALREHLPHRDIRAAFIDDSPALADVIDDVDKPVIVIPWFIADGMHPTADIPSALGLPKRTAEQWRIDHAGGRCFALAPALGSVATFGKVIGKMAHAAFHARTHHPETGDTIGVASPHSAAVSALEECIYQKEKYRFGDVVIRMDSNRYESETYQVQIRREKSGTNGGTLLEPDVAQFERRVIAAREKQAPVPYAQDNAHLRGGFTTDDIRLVARAIDTVYPGAVYAWHEAQIGSNPPSFAEYTANLPGRLSKHANASEDDVASAVSSVCDTCCQRTPHWHRPNASCENDLSCRAPCHAIYKALD